MSGAGRDLRAVDRRIWQRSQIDSRRISVVPKKAKLFAIGNGNDRVLRKVHVDLLGEQLEPR
ncbi:hypothetical protein D3C87_1978320 [compost metagenome]